MRADALEYLNVAYRSLCSGHTEFDIDLWEPFYWARSEHPKVVEVLAAIETGTVAFTKDSTTATYSSAPSVSTTDWFLKVDTIPELYKISAHTASTTGITLRSNFLNTTGSYNYEAIKLIYDLGDIMRIVEPLTIYKSKPHDDDDGKIWGMRLDELRKEYPHRSLAKGNPDRFAVFFKDASTFKILMSSYPSAKFKAEVEYIPYPTALTDATDVPIVPLEDRIVLAYMVAAYLIGEKKDTVEYQKYYALAKAKIKAMMESNFKQRSQISKWRGKVIPRRDRL
jgi:hypothetical protein